MARILTAVAPDTEERVRRILTGHELLFVSHFENASDTLADNGIKLILIGARFDESRMFDLLHHLRRDAAYKNIPVVAAIIAPTNWGEETVSGLAHTTKILGASVFINLNDFADEETENLRLRLIVEALLVPADRVPDVAAALSSSAIRQTTLKPHPHGFP